jgi:TonB-dependent starch-binding outer membrane protein SusC
MKKIILSLTAAIVLVLMAFSPKNKHTVSGVITDENNNALNGAMVKVKGTALATTSDKTGAYSIEVNEKDILVITMVGYKPEEVAVNKRTVINIKLSPDANALQEVVVTALGSQDKKDH